MYRRRQRIRRKKRGKEIRRQRSLQRRRDIQCPSYIVKLSVIRLVMIDVMYSAVIRVATLSRLLKLLDTSKIAKSGRH